MKNPEKVVEHIVEWLKSYALESNMNGFVVGVSGGIDLVCPFRSPSHCLGNANPSRL